MFSLTKIDPAGRISIQAPAPTYIDVFYEMGCRNINTISLKLIYTKVIGDFSVLASYKDTRQDPAAVVPTIANDRWIDETYTDAAGNVQLCLSHITIGSGNYRLLYNPMKDEEWMRFRFTPSHMAGGDSLIIDINENSLGA